MLLVVVVVVVVVVYIDHCFCNWLFDICCVCTFIQVSCKI